MTSDIKLVSNSSTITMMHGPINIRFTMIELGGSYKQYTWVALSLIRNKHTICMHDRAVCCLSSHYDFVMTGLRHQFTMSGRQGTAAL